MNAGEASVIQEVIIKINVCGVNVIQLHVVQVHFQLIQSLHKTQEKQNHGIFIMMGHSKSRYRKIKRLSPTFSSWEKAGISSCFFFSSLSTAAGASGSGSEDTTVVAATAARTEAASKDSSLSSAWYKK